MPYTEEQYKLPAMDIRASDLFGIYLADKLLIQYEGTPIFDSLCSVFAKIEQSLPDKISLDSASDQEKFTVLAASGTTIVPGIWESLIDGLRTSRQVEIDYKTPGKEVNTRRLDPYHGVRYEGDWYVVGYCHLRNEIRPFSLSRIVKVKNTGQQFQIPPDFDFQRLSGSHFGVHWSEDEFPVKIRFDKTVAEYIKERNWHPEQEIKECDNGDVILSLTVNHLLELKRWILSWGHVAHVLEPESFAQDLRLTLHSALVNYG